MEAICLQDILKDIASYDCDSMTRHAAAAKMEPPVDEWKTLHETPSLLFFTEKEEEAQEKILVDFLNKKFREVFSKEVNV